MKTKILITVILLLININSTFSQEEGLNGDFGIGGTAGTNLKIRISSFSIPFEGITNPKTNFIPFNRINNIQNGVNYRFFSASNIIDSSNIALFYFEGTIGSSGIVFDLGHVSGAEFPDAGINNAYGFCKYLIEFEIPLTGEKYSLFYNTLDSKFGGKFPDEKNYFIGDIYIRYIDSLPLNKRLKVERDIRSGPNAGFSDIDTISTSDTLPNGLPSKEIKVWDIYFGNNSSPYEKKFYARSTPFPISSLSAQDTNMRRELIIGTKVVFDTVFRNNDDILNGLDTSGYNTQNNPYYLSPKIPFNKPGRTYLTPGTFKFYPLTASYEYGIKIIAEENDTMIFNDSLRFWIFGTGQFQNGVMQGDTLVLKQGSTLILGEASEIFTHRGGVLIDEGANRVWEYGSCHRAFPNTAINFTGESHTVNNGGFIVIDGEANLNIGDNTTLTFDGNNTFLKLDPSAKVTLGANSKIEFKNGAYLIADSCIFSGNNGAIWGGLVFHNAGGQTQIKNCTFNDAKISIDIKNTTGCYADLEKRITGNTFNQPSIGSHSIRAENVFKLLLQGNTFNIAANKTGVEILNRINAGNSQEDGGN